MDIETQRKIDRIAGSLICRVVSLYSLFRRDAEPAKPRKILVILLSEMGALFLTRPMLDRILEKYPDARLYALVFRQNKEVLDLLGAIPEKNILTLRNDTLSHLAGDSLGALRNMRRIGIDTVVDCELFSRISSIFSYLSGADIRVGFHPHTQEGLYRGSFINRPVLYNPYLHIGHQFLNLAEAIESSDTPTVKRVLDGDALHVPEPAAGREKIEAFIKKLQGDFPQIVGKSLVLIYPGGGLLPIRAWPPENYCTVARDLVHRGYAVGIIGLKADRPLAREIQSHCNNESCVDLTGYTKTIRELMLLFHLASLLITNDGGPVHFASMTPIPSIVFYGPETPVLYGPLDDKSTVFYENLSCSPCLTAYNHRKSPCDGNNVCLRSIAPEYVLEKAHDILRKRYGMLLQ